MSSTTGGWLTAVRDTFKTSASLSAFRQGTTARAYVVQALSEEYIPSLPSQMPFALIYPSSRIYTPASMMDCTGINQATLAYGISVFDEYRGRDGGLLGNSSKIKGVCYYADLLKTVFDRQLLSVVHAGEGTNILLSADYGPAGLSSYSGLAQVHLTFEFFDPTGG